MNLYILKHAKNEIIFLIFLFLLILLSILQPYKIKDYPSFVNWRTIIALTELLIITTGLKESGYLYYLSRQILRRLKTEQTLSLFLIFLSALLASFLTNDVTLFIVIPITLSLRKLLKNSVTKIVVFEVIAVNVGSTLTPIGNPQNLFLWQNWGISFINFVIKLFPVVALLLLVLFLFALLSFKKVPLYTLKHVNVLIKNNPRLLSISFIFIVTYLICLELRFTFYLLPIVFLVYITFFRKVVIKTDWLLIAMFIIIFVDFRVISQFHFVLTLARAFNLSVPKNVFIFSLLTSQIISNVPASVLVSNFSHNWLAIIYGVNVGGNGFLIASLANIIALRLAKQEKKIWLSFHKYSLIYLIISTVLIYIFIVILPGILI